MSTPTNAPSAAARSAVANAVAGGYAKGGDEDGTATLVFRLADFMRWHDEQAMVPPPADSGRPEAVDPEGPATNYHDTVDDLRRDLVKASALWEATSTAYTDQVMRARQEGATLPEPVTDAHMASTMAMSYSYALAAVLKVASRDIGEDAARALAFEVDELLQNGDFDDINGDVSPDPQACY